ncbi:MAG TPA: hypothetical protein VIM48_03155, partial [Chthoniobacterales bacterium]
MKWLSILLVMVPLALRASDLNVSGSVSANSGGHVWADSYFQTPGSGNFGSWISAGGQITTSSYFSANSYGTFGTTLKVGPGTIAGTGNTYTAVFGPAPVTNSYASFIVGRYNVDKANDGTAVTPG